MNNKTQGPLAKKRAAWTFVSMARTELPADLQANVVELVERLLVTRFPDLTLEDIRMKFYNTTSSNGSILFYY
jgi:hypothetical protein